MISLSEIHCNQLDFNRLWVLCATMTSTVRKDGIEPLTRMNWPIWAARMKVKLRSLDCWDAVDPDSNGSERDAEAMQAIVKHVSDDLLSHVLDSRTSREAWTTLRDSFKKSVRARAQTLGGKLYTIKQDDGESIEQYFAKAADIRRQLQVVDEDCTEGAMVSNLKRGLRQELYANIGQTA